MFARIVTGEETGVTEIESVALPPITTLPIEKWIQGGKLAARLVLQSA